MITLYPEKLLSIITISSMEDRLVSMFKKYGVSGFTILRARGEGSSGYEADISGFDSNILVTVIVSEKRMEPILESIERKLKKGYHLTTYISDVQVISPDKFN
ncbi:MAG: transcriptional regulator [Gammaproteobacteria bacterium]|nr:transcriptional regulator [Gammaproteobacteria bacterium]MCF6260004.1 transcriptional regulator [Gammaproteobacteria bacterium]